MKTLIFDLDGVLVDVTRSYWEVVRQTVKFFTKRGANLNTIQSLKEEGGFGNEWLLTQELIKRQGKDIDFNIVKSKFQEICLGNDYNGLIQNDRLCLPKNTLKKLSKKYNLAIVTGRPREEAEFFLNKNGIRNLFKAIICKEDVGKREKPDPSGILLALKELKTNEGAYYFGDSVDDVKAALRANITPIGVIPGYVDKKKLRELLIKNDASKVLDDINKIEEVFLK